MGFFFAVRSKLGKTPEVSLAGLVYHSGSKKSDVVNKQMLRGISKVCSVFSKMNMIKHASLGFQDDI